MKKYLSAIFRGHLLAAMLLLPALAYADMSTPTTKLFSDRDTVTGASATLFTNTTGTLPSGARRMPSNTKTLSLTIVWVSGDDCFFDINPDTQVVVNGVYTDRVWVGSARPFVEFGVFNPQILKAISAGTTVVDWYVTYL